ncbi:MAG TPA: YoaK family protein [Acidobacteriaceae bacterium]|nr:YoaK family protein [Acidobacteriaceae bacterium]
MPLRRLTGRERSSTANWQLAGLLAFTAGVVDIAGYMSLRQFTSHMSGTVAAIAADFAAGGVRVFFRPVFVLACFLAGAAFCAVVVNWERRRNRESLFAVPLLIEALLLAVVPLFGGPQHLFPSLAVLGFAMGLQNAVITKVSQHEIRTTHVTGMVTDIGIELGKLFYWNRTTGRTPVLAERRRLALLSGLVGLFFAGGALSAVLFSRAGFGLLLPLAVMLAAPTVLPIASDLQAETAQA